ncbi:MAG: Lpg1974 family pore-forming outer membrane protein [Pirellulales bacterium]|nr:Lpg1974 family pore-forming outer membrane protein [Pirellulales bacterium]
MNRNYFFLLLSAIGALLASGGSVAAQQPQSASLASLMQRIDELEYQVAQTQFLEESSVIGCGCNCGDSCSGCGCGVGGGGGGRLAVLTELLFLRFHESDGVDNVQSNGIDRYEFNPCYRLTFGYQMFNGLSLRVRYFEHDHSAVIDGDPLYAVETYNVDLELAQQLRVGRATTVEINGGVRYNHYEHQEQDTLNDEEFDGTGLIVGAEARRSCWLGNLYGRMRHSILLGDSIDPADGTFRGDVALGQLELALGFEFRRTTSSGCVLSLGTGFEIQEWFTYEDDQEEVGFGGFALNAGMNY